MFLILLHPMMRPDVGFIELPAGLVFWDSIAPLPECGHEGGEPCHG